MPATPFLESTYRMMEAGDPSCGWGMHQGRDSVLIRDPVAMVSRGPGGEPSVMQRFFRHNNMSSFERQLNYYGFTKVRSGTDGAEYFHPIFRRGNLAEALTLKRRKKVKQEAASSSSESASLARPGADMSVLIQRQQILESRLAAMEGQAARVQELEARLAAMEKKQTFLSTAVQDIFLFIVGVYSGIVRNLPLVKGQQLPMIEDDKSGGPRSSSTTEPTQAAATSVAAAAAGGAGAQGRQAASAASGSATDDGASFKSTLPIPLDLSSVDLQGLTDFSKLQNIFSPANNISMELVQATIPTGLNAQRFKRIAWLLQAANPATPITPVAVEYTPQMAGAAAQAQAAGAGAGFGAGSGSGSGSGIDSSMSAAQAFAQLPVLNMGDSGDSGQDHRGTKRQRHQGASSASASASVSTASTPALALAARMGSGSGAESPQFLAQMEALATAETQQQQHQLQQQQQQQQYQPHQPHQPLNRQDSLMDDLADLGDLDVELGDEDDLLGLGVGDAHAQQHPPISPMVVKSEMQV